MQGFVVDNVGLGQESNDSFEFAVKIGDLEGSIEGVIHLSAGVASELLFVNNPFTTGSEFENLSIIPE